ncbi:nucleotide pyrophosphohydrolase [Gemella sanguinis]|uniref:nucleotide pyrophosphohydrolase n=1 Tax=Gemella sanguinis TaxID=84135 RepID=UPI0004E12739|nr:nucleotide pyrophosphohydrolase [Gemella sanguinis]NKZ26621.1 nucleotide pyrophosphohydrolase [Gemella sanguinis]
MKSTIEKINKFRDDRNWRQFHKEKDLAISISLEANELLEIFQWKTSEEAVANDLEHIKEELADVFIYGLMLADNLNLDVEKIISDKIKLNEKKYPLAESFGNKEKYTELKKEK